VTDAPEALTEEAARIDPPLSFHTKIVNRQKAVKQKTDLVVRRSQISLQKADRMLHFGQRKNTGDPEFKKGSMTERNNVSANLSRL
jgi:hypothetical protein